MSKKQTFERLREAAKELADFYSAEPTEGQAKMLGLNEGRRGDIRRVRLQSATRVQNASGQLLGQELTRSRAEDRPTHQDSDEFQAIKTSQDLGRLVRTARKAMKLNQQAFADLAGVGRRFLSELEAGKPSLEFGRVLTVCKAAGIDLAAHVR